MRDLYFECIDLGIDKSPDVSTVPLVPPSSPSSSETIAPAGESKDSSSGISSEGDGLTNAPESSDNSQKAIAPDDNAPIGLPSAFCSSTTLYILDCLNFDLRTNDLTMVAKYIPFLVGIILFPCMGPPASEEHRAFFLRYGQASTRFVSARVLFLCYLSVHKC